VHSFLKTLLRVWCVLVTVSLQAQNLVPNPSFEEVNICTEYRVPCAPAGWFTVSPIMAKMMYLCNSNADYGQHYVSVVPEGLTPQRVYLQTRLLRPLQAGSAYRIRMYMKTENYPLRADIRFDTAFLFTDAPVCLPYPPTIQLSEEDTQKKTGHSEWVILEKTFTLKSAATHMLIGNFNPAPGHAGNEALMIDSMSITPVNPSTDTLALADSTVITDSSVIKQLYAEHHRHSIPNALVRGMVSRVSGSAGCDTLILKDDLFSPDHTSLSYHYRQQVQDALKSYHDGHALKVQLFGYSWQRSSEAYNKIISYDKAKAVADYLVYNDGFSYDDFEIQGMGRSYARYDTSGASATDNNRVEMIVCHPPDTLITIAQKLPPPPDTLLVPDMLFRFDSSELNPKLYAALDSLIRKIPRDQSIELQVTGHTDNAGSPAYNYSLSLKRANSVARYLEAHGLGNDIRQVNGMGEQQPMADNKTPEGRRRNRRVEIIVFYSTD
jgi:outer membrane protein OmpA-like peptidoglycan-associated protein